MKIKFISRIVALAMLASSFYLLGSARGAAQSYYTNAASGSFFGAQQYNQNYPNPLQPSLTLNRQYQAGINAVTGNSGIWSYATNTFATNCTYSAIPAVTVQQSGAWTGPQTNAVLAVTTTNYIDWFGGATNVNYSVLAIGR